MKTEYADVVVVGAGAAGLMTALMLYPQKVLVLSEKTLGGICASCWAQGGIAAAVGKDDHTQKHIADTLKAAAGTADAGIVSMIIDKAPAYIEILEKLGVHFEKDAEGHYKLSREACHSERRVLKALAGDGFGFELMRALTEAVVKSTHISFAEEVTAERILRADDDRSGALQGILARDLTNDEVRVFYAPYVVMATGGAGALYQYTTNPLNAVGRGVALAARAGAVLADLEFVQFHPTALDIGEDPCPLATEALRGEGAVLVNSRGERFMRTYHKDAELAPRDVVSRGIFAEIMAGKKVYLDCRKIDTAHFTALRQAAARAGLDPARDLIPVQPAVHYHMGGIATDQNGRASIDSLWAAGEVASTGLHGANRLASNSLLEAVIMGGQVAADIQKRITLEGVRVIEARTVLPEFYVDKPKTANAAAHIRQIMTEEVGVIREAGRLKKAVRLLREIEEAATGIDSATADMALMAGLIALMAYERRESRGGHARSDYREARADYQHRSFTTLKHAQLKRQELLVPTKVVMEKVG
jgi:L-aspartate oxidase